MDEKEYEKRVIKLTCLRCNYSWIPRSPKKPKDCANQVCRSEYWDRPRVNKRRVK